MECRYGAVADMGAKDMKVVILAGGKGTRISEESQLRPKPMIEIGGMPILWHIMKMYSYYGYHEFIVCCGYKGQMIKKYFTNYFVHHADSTFMLQNRQVTVHERNIEPWKVTLANTGLETLTAGRILKIRDYIEDDEFLLTYGDGVSDVDISAVVEFHHRCGRAATITTVQPEGRFGAIKIDPRTNQIESFKEKARVDQAWVNAGFMVLNRKVFDYLGDGSMMLEAEPFEKLAADGQMTAYQHSGFWSPMDTMRDREYLEGLWQSGKAPWKQWQRGNSIE